MSSIPSSTVHFMSVSQGQEPGAPIELRCVSCNVTLEQFRVDSSVAQTNAGMMRVIATAVDSFRAHAKVPGKCAIEFTDIHVPDLCKEI